MVTQYNLALLMGVKPNPPPNLVYAGVPCLAARETLISQPCLTKEALSHTSTEAERFYFTKIFTVFWPAPIGWFWDVCGRPDVVQFG